MMFWHEMEIRGDRLALIGADGRRWTHADLVLAADALTQGAEVRNLVLLPMANRAESIIAYLAALRAGWPVIIVNEGDDAAAARMIETFRPGLRWDGARFAPTGVAEPAGLLHPELAVLLSTSGTTGSTKLVRLSRGAVDANARSIAEYLGLTPDERAITTLPPSYSYGLSVLNSHLAAGASLVLNEASVIEPGFRALLARSEATSLAGVPYTYELLEHGGLLRALPPTLRTLTQAGGRMPAERVERVATLALAEGRRLFIMYGQTEATARMAYLPSDRLPELADCIGRAVPGGRFELRDPDTGALADGRGELVYSGPNVMMGYAERVEDLSLGHEIERLHTGDLAEEAEPGLYRIVGRKSRFIKMFGLRLSLDEIEKEAARLGQPVTATGRDEQLVLATEQADPERDIARAIAARYHLPEARVVHRDYERLPRLPSGKVDYQAILRDVPPAAAAGPIDPSAGNAEKLVTAAFAEMFGEAAADGEASFTSLGGDSFNYVQMSMALERAIPRLPEGWRICPSTRLAR